MLLICLRWLVYVHTSNWADFYYAVPTKEMIAEPIFVLATPTFNDYLKTVGRCKSPSRLPLMLVYF
jgi:hypothetical protein